MLTSVLVALALVCSSIEAGTVTYSSGGYSLTVVDNSNGAVSSSAIQTQVNFFFSTYPGLASGYSNAPTSITMRLEPSIEPYTVEVGTDGFGLSTADVINYPSENHVEFPLEYILSNFFSTVGPTTVKTTVTTTKPTTTTTKATTAGSGISNPSPNVYTQGGYTLTIVDKSNGAIPASTIQNQINFFFSTYPAMAAQYTNAPTSLTFTIDPALAQGSVGVSTTSFSRSTVDMTNSPNSNLVQFPLNYILTNYYTPKSTSAAAATSTTTKPTTVISTTTKATTVISTTSGSGTITNPSPNVYKQGIYTLTINDKSNGQVPQSTIMNQVQLFFSLYPGMAAQYNNPPTSVTLTIDPSMGDNSIGAGSNTIMLGVSTLQNSPNYPGYIQSRINYMLSTFYTKKWTITTQPPPSSGMTAESRQLAIDVHNKLRSKVAKGQAPNKNGTNLPTASNLYKVTYSMLVESYAQQVADTCDWNHQNINNTNNNLYQDPGYYFKPVANLVNDSIYAWYSELAEYGQPDMKIYSPTGHFTQVIWGSTIEIGCAVKYCSTMTNLSGGSTPGTYNFVVCEYWPFGNIGGQNMYNPGSPASACTTYPNSVGNTTSGLCQIQGRADIHA